MKNEDMKLKTILNEKKEAIATSPNTNMTLHYDPQFNEIGESGKPEFSYTISISSTGGKDFNRVVSGKEEEQKMAEAVKLELRRALRKFDARVALINEKYNIKAV
jgi:hypothetical protein|tara:strand:- start:353 stop:667 length:315 start_codon:yes stop_codon:yes gene_type:complete